MAFGLSGDDNRSKMVGGDTAVAWVDKATLKGYAVDYFFDDKSQCSGTRGSCPDERLRVSTTTSIPLFKLKATTASNMFSIKMILTIQSTFGFMLFYLYKIYESC